MTIYRVTQLRAFGGTQSEEFTTRKEAEAAAAKIKTEPTAFKKLGAVLKVKISRHRI